MSFYLWQLLDIRFLSKAIVKNPHVTIRFKIVHASKYGGLKNHLNG